MKIVVEEGVLADVYRLQVHVEGTIVKYHATTKGSIDIIRHDMIQTENIPDDFVEIKEVRIYVNSKDDELTVSTFTCPDSDTLYISSDEEGKLIFTMDGKLPKLEYHIGGCLCTLF